MATAMQRQSTKRQQPFIEDQIPQQPVADVHFKLTLLGNLSWDKMHPRGKTP